MTLKVVSCAAARSEVITCSRMDLSTVPRPPLDNCVDDSSLARLDNVLLTRPMYLATRE